MFKIPVDTRIVPVTRERAQVLSAKERFRVWDGNKFVYHLHGEPTTKLELVSSLNAGAI